MVDGVDGSRRGMRARATDCQIKAVMASSVDTKPSGASDSTARDLRASKALAGKVK